MSISLTLLFSLSLSSLSSAVSPCRCCVIGVIFIPLSVTVVAGWLNIYIFHSLVTFPCCHSGSSSLLAALLLTDYRLQISYGHNKWHTGSLGQRVQRLEKGVKKRKKDMVVTTLTENGLKKQKYWRSTFICRDMDWSGVFYLWCHLDCDSLSASIVCNKLPANNRKSRPSRALGAIENIRKYKYLDDKNCAFEWVEMHLSALWVM